MPDFLFLTCQIGAEKAVKEEIARRWAGFRFAFSRPGFLTFKLPPDHGLAEDFDLESVFARAYGFSLGGVPGRRKRSLPPGCGKAAKGSNGPENPRLAAGPGRAGRTWFEPGITPAAIEAHRLLFEHCPNPKSLAKTAGDPMHPARTGELVLDCVMIAPNQWWAGYHRVKSVPSRYPGGMMPLELPPEAVSRAWLKMEEALRWSQLPIPRGRRWPSWAVRRAGQARPCWLGG